MLGGRTAHGAAGDGDYGAFTAEAGDILGEDYGDGGGSRGASGLGADLLVEEAREGGAGAGGGGERAQHFGGWERGVRVVLARREGKTVLYQRRG